MTTTAEDEPRPDPGGAALWRKRSNPNSASLAILWIERHRRDLVEIERLYPDLPVLTGPEGSVYESVDRRAQDLATLFPGIGLDVRAAAGETDPEGCPGAQQPIRAIGCDVHHTTV